MSWFIWITLFLYAVNFKSRGFLFFAAAFLVMVRKHRFVYKLLAEDVLAVGFIAVLFAIAVGNGDRRLISAGGIIQTFLLPLMAYYFGRIAAGADMGASDKGAMFEILGFGTCVYGVLNLVKRYELGYQLIPWLNAGRMCADFWIGYDIVQTKEATYFLISACLLFYSFVIRKGRWRKLCYAAVTLALATVTLDIGSRTLLLIAVVIFGSESFVLLFIQKQYHKTKWKLVAGAGFVIFAVMILYSNDIWGIKTIYRDSIFYQRLSGNSYDSVNGLLDINGRNDRYYLFFTQMLTHPFGGIQLGELGSAHNTFLDIYRLAGFIPFLIFAWFFLSMVRNQFRLVKETGFFYPETLLLASIMMGFAMQFMGESIVLLNPLILQIYFMVSGYLLSRVHEGGLSDDSY